MRIIAIDPGYERLGIAIMEKTKNTKETVLYSDCFFTSASLSHPERLALLGAEIEKLIESYRPEALSIETLFFNKNQKTAFKVAEARGTILYVAAAHKLKISEYTPLQIKIAVTGYGRSDKKQMISMIDKIVALSKDIKYDDEYDALAAGITFFAFNR